MRHRYRLLCGLFLLTALVGTACGPETVRVTPSPLVSPTTAAPTPSPSPTRTATSVPTTAAPTPTPTPTTSPGGTPNTACTTLTGGSPVTSSQLTAIRAAHNPGFDRLVFEWSGAAVPQYEIKVASTFTAPSGQAVRVDGNAFFSVRINGQAHTDAGARSYPQSDPFRPALPLIREVKLVEDFEGVVIFGVGLERLACPTVLTLLSPARIVLDFPTPP
jgi:hypothetical protein